MNTLKHVHQVSVYLKGDHLDPGDLTTRFGVEPTQSHRRGSPRLTSSNRKLLEKTGLWALSIKSESKELSEMLEELANKFSKDAAALVPASGVDEAYIDVFIAVSAEDDGGGTSEFDLSQECLSALARLGLPARFTVAVVRE